MEKQQLIDYIMDSPENTNPAILNQMIDEVGGGGSGDFNTCTGTFICDGADYNRGLILGKTPYIDDNELKIFNDTIMSTTDFTLDVLLYKGKITIELNEEWEGHDLVSISGNIENIDPEYPNLYEITGDFTIHYFASKGSK